jgi:transposase-like protein
MMTKRGLSVDHSTIFRWVQRYSPELDKRCRPHLKLTNDSWRVDETRSSPIIIGRDHGMLTLWLSGEFRSS